MIIKVCGIKTDQLLDLEKLKVDLIGRIFHTESPRDMSDEEAVNTETAQIGVFVNQTTDEIMAQCDRHKLSVVQLHGQEDISQLKSLKTNRLKVIKALSIADELPIKEIEKYAPHCDCFLFDTKGLKAGGNGKRFDWTVLENYSADKLFILSGGISPAHVDDVLAIDHPYFAGVDLNSGFETEPGKKDINALTTFINKLRNG